MSDKKVGFSSLLNSLDQQDALAILFELSRDPTTKKALVQHAKARLELREEVDCDAVADAVFRSLNAIDVHDLWEHSGKTRYGYQDPYELAYEMLEDVIEPYGQEMLDRHGLGFLQAERAYCIAIVRGLLRYAEQGNNEFRQWCPDDPYDIAENTVVDWAKRNPDDSVDALRSDAGMPPNRLIG